MDALAFLQSWYRAQCNGEWEHQYGVTIESLDNPGWQVSIDLVSTALAGRSMPETRAEPSPQDWLVWQVDHNVFRAAGDYAKLPQILEIFQKWASAAVE